MFEAFFEALLRRDAGGRSWFPGLLAAAPLGRERLGPLVDDPGSLVTTIAVPGASGRLGAFEWMAAPPRPLLEWYVEHPERLERPDAPATAEEDRLRRALLDDDPPGSRARAQERARELLVTRSPLTRGWWRFEDIGTLDCLLISHRLVLTVVDGDAGASRAVTPWFPTRGALARALESARATAQGHRWATLVLSTDPLPEGDPETVAAALAAGAPHLAEAERAELAGAYLGNLTWAQAAAATGSGPPPADPGSPAAG